MVTSPPNPVVRSAPGDLVAAYPVLGRLPAGLAAALAADAQRFQAPPGRVLFDVEGACSQFVLLTAGSIRVVKPAPNGREIVLYRVQRGDSCILTVSCLLGHSGYPARGMTESEVTGYQISHALFERLVGEANVFRAFVFRYFAERIVRLMALVEGVAFAPLEQRLAAALLAQAFDGRTLLTTTHQQLADEIGSVREVVSRTLKEFEERGMVRLARGRITVCDRQLLESLAGPLR